MKHFNFEMETTGHKELVRWILSWLPEVQVLVPLELKARVVARLKAGLPLMREK